MKIEMLKTIPGAIGGLIVKKYEQGKIYDTNANPHQIDLEVVQTFLKIKVAKIYNPPNVEGNKAQRRILKSFGAAPSNKMEEVEENKEVEIVGQQEEVLTADFFKDWKAGKIKHFASEKGIDLSDLPANTKAEKCVEELLKRLKK